MRETYMKHLKLTNLFLILILILIVAIPIIFLAWAWNLQNMAAENQVKFYELPPGCARMPFVSDLFAGGCFGTRMIKNLTVEPEFSCLHINVNNCNGGNLEILNYYDESVVILGEKIEEKHINERGTTIAGLSTIYPVRMPSGEIAINGSGYPPKFDDFMTINGTVGNKTIRISYIKTRALC